MGRFGEKPRDARLLLFRHVLRNDGGYIGSRILRMELPGKKEWGRLKMRFTDAAMAVVEVTEEGAEERSK